MGGSSTPPVDAQASTPASRLRRDAVAPHGRNGKLPGGQHVGHDAAAHGAHQTIGYDGDLGATTTPSTQNRER